LPEKAGHAIMPVVGSLERFDCFRRIVLGDPDLQVRLRSIRDWQAFVQAALEAAAEAGVGLTTEDILAARTKARRSWLERWV
jgi:hypothetical protein